MYDKNRYPALRDALTDPETAERFSRMFTIGTQGLHESGFAIYDSSDSVGAHEVSRLVVPEFDSQDFFDVIASKSHTSINLSTLYKVKAEDYGDDEDARSKEQILVYNACNGRFSNLPDTIVNTIKNIQRSDDYDPNEKEMLIKRVVDVELKRRGEKTETRRRTDIGFMFHNHPQLPNLAVATKSLVTPSEEDLAFTQHVAKYSPQAIQGVVGSDTFTHAVLLFAPAHGDVARPLEYRFPDVEYLEKARQALGRAGYASLFLRLHGDGTVANGQSGLLNEFAESTR